MHNSFVYAFNYPEQKLRNTNKALIWLQVIN